MIILKSFKLAIKVFLILIVLLVVVSYVKTNSKKLRIRYFQTWRRNYNSYVKKKDRVNTKYMLIWFKGEKEWAILEEKSVAFKKNKCLHDNCYVSYNKDYLDNDYRNFDAIIINGKSIVSDVITKLPEKRYENQIYVFASAESADNYPVCKEIYDHYFNLTWTYRLDSDVPWPYFLVYNTNHEVVGPRINMNWERDYKPVNNSVKKTLKQKHNLAAWFVSHCYTKSRRESLAYRIISELKKYNHTVHVVGSCTNIDCPFDFVENCVEILKRFYFYFAFENSLANDYVSEKVLKALAYNTVPVVFGGANYSRFLPPNSYIDAGKLGAVKTAARLVYLRRNKTAYADYFRWQNHYYFRESSNSVCGLCEALNKNRKKVYKNFRQWWNMEDVANKTCSL